MDGLAAPPHAWPGWAELLRVLAFQGGYNTSLVLLGVTLLGAAAGTVGSFALLRRRALMSDVLSHAALPGLCLAFLGAALLGVSGRTVRRLAQRGELPYVRLGGVTRFRLGDVDRLVRANVMPQRERASEDTPSVPNPNSRTDAAGGKPAS